MPTQAAVARDLENERGCASTPNHFKVRGDFILHGCVYHDDGLEDNHARRQKSPACVQSVHKVQSLYVVKAYCI